MELNKSLVLFLIVATIIIETSTGAPPPPSPSGNMTCLPDLMMCSDGTASTLCCNSLRSIYDSDPNCLCAAQTTETFASLIGINGTQISELMDECKINTSTTFCSAAPPLPFGPTLPFQSPPGLPLHAPPPPNEASALCKATWVRLSGLASLFLFIFFGWI